MEIPNINSRFLGTRVATKMCVAERQITKDKCATRKNYVCMTMEMGYLCPLALYKRRTQ